MQLAFASTGRLQVLPSPAERTQTCLVSRKQHHSMANSRSHVHTRRAFTDQPAQVDMEDPKVGHSAKLLLPDNACKATPCQWSASGASTNASYARADATARGPRADEGSAGPDARQRICRKSRKVEGELARLAAIACTAACMTYSPCLRHHMCILCFQRATSCLFHAYVCPVRKPQKAQVIKKPFFPVLFHLLIGRSGASAIL